MILTYIQVKQMECQQTAHLAIAQQFHHARAGSLTNVLPKQRVHFVPCSLSLLRSDVVKFYLFGHSKGRNVRTTSTLSGQEGQSRCAVMW